MAAALTGLETGFQTDQSPEEAEIVIEEILADAAEAREDAKKFFEFVIRSEQDNTPIQVAAHQALILEFVDAFPHCVILLPFGHAKTFTLTGIALKKLGDDHFLRGAMVSNAQAQAEKPVGLVRQYIESSGELALVYPRLRRTQRPGEPWTTTDLTVDRPMGIRDPSLVARGLDSKVVLGSRWKWGLFDDVLNEENTSSPEQRDKIWNKLEKEHFNRIDPKGGLMVWVSTAWHEDDVSHRLMKPKAEGGKELPALIMRADGLIFLRNTEKRDAKGNVIGYWDSDLIRPDDDRLAGDQEASYRLVAHDPDPEGKVTLWPERIDAELLEQKREEHHPALFNQMFLNICRDDASSLCKQEYIDKALALGRRMGFMAPVAGVEGYAFPIFVGVDLAFSVSDKADECAIFVMAVHPDPDFAPGAAGGFTLLDSKVAKKRPLPIRTPLWIEHGRWGADELYKRLQAIDARFHPMAFAVENNGAQEGIRKLMVAGDKTLVLKPHTTDGTKNTIAMGIPSIFAEMANGAWALPNKHDGANRVQPAIRAFMSQCLNYAPGAHTGDILMAAYFARDLARKWGVLSRGAGGGGGSRIGDNLMAR